MLKKLRRRFVAISMSVICSVLIFFYLISGTVIFVSVTYDVRSVLETYARTTEIAAMPQIGGNNQDNSVYALYSGNVCVVDIRELGSVAVLDFSRADMDPAILSKAVSSVLSSDSDFGRLSSLNLIYYKHQTEFGHRVAFADSVQYFEYLKMILRDGMILIVLSSFVLAAIMRFLAKMCLKPVEKAWEQQKIFIADSSHELKTPLTVILTNSGILKSHKNDTVDNQMKWIDSTYEEAIHMKELVDKLLLLAKTDDISKKNMFSDVDLSELSTQLSLQYEPVAFENGIILMSDIEKDIHIEGDSVALNQIIHILLDNAIKYSPSDSVVTLSLKKRQSYSFRKNAGYIYLSTHNTGEPIPQEDIPYLFERFYRSDKARTLGGGYGLGLSICKNLATLHNAEIFVTSDKENGTVFTVKFRQNGRNKR